MAYEPTVRTSGYRSRSPKYSGASSGASISRHSLRIFQNLEQDNQISKHRALTPSPSATATLANISFQGQPTVSEGLPSGASVKALGVDAFGGKPFISKESAKIGVDAIAEAFSNRRVARDVARFGTDTSRVSPGALSGTGGGFSSSGTRGGITVPAGSPRTGSTTIQPAPGSNLQAIFQA
jgi:hypothetical protein